MTGPFQSITPRESRLQELVDSLDRSVLSEPPSDLLQFARKEAPHQDVCERRRDRRYSLITNVIVVPINDKLRPVGQPFVALSSGMSVSGIRLIHTQPSPSELLFLEIEGQPVTLLLSVVRSQPVGYCYEIAGRLTKADVANHKADSSPLLVPKCHAIRDITLAADHGDFSLPTTDEQVQWAGITAAVQILNPRWTGP